MAGNVGRSILNFFTGEGPSGVNGHKARQERRQPVVHSQGKDSRIVMYDDNSMSGTAARANANFVYGRNNVSSGYARRAVIEVQSQDGSWVPVNQIDPGAPMEQQIAALHAFRETGQIGGTVNGSNLITSGELPGGDQGVDGSQALQLASRQVSEGGQTGQGGQQTATQSDFAPTQAVRPLLGRPGAGRNVAGTGGPNGAIMGTRGETAYDQVNGRPISGTMRQYADAIAAVESKGSGDYRAMGRVMDKGSYKGDRAYGRYQVMGRNVPQWTKAALGVSMTPEEFLANDAAQDAVFAHQFQKSIDKFGTPQDAASVWFTGRPAATGGQRSDGNINGNEYIRRFNAALGSPSSSSAQVAELASGQASGQAGEAAAPQTAQGVGGVGRRGIPEPYSPPVQNPQLVGENVQALTGRTASKVDRDSQDGLALAPQDWIAQQQNGQAAHAPYKFF